jgi:uncharacterized protein (TIGR00661 family)
MQKQKRILICPLDWGLGHATRCIPIIRLLLQKNAEVIIAADGRPLALLQQEFPQLQFIVFRGYSISYPDSGSMAFKMLLAAPKILKGIKEEHLALQKIIEAKKIDIVISDNRYGCWSKKARSIFITHQLMIKSPFAEKLLHKKVLRYVANYDECWVPDLEGGNNLSGDLAHKYPLPANAFFIGPLSRFTFSDPAKPEYDVMAIISGPEPQRTIFEQLLRKQIQESNLKYLLVLGTPEVENSIREDKNVKSISHLNTSDMEQCILKSKIIVARSGYSTIMDLAVLGKKAVFVPTPGQTEQEYLAESLSNRGIAYSQNQSDFDLQKALTASEQFSGFDKMDLGVELEKRIEFILR